jgi:hypothetical protein
MHEKWSWHAYRFALGFLWKIGCDIGSSGPQSSPWSVRWQHTQVTNSKKKEKKRKKNSSKWSKAKQKPRKDHLSEQDLGPLRQGQWLNTTEIKFSKIVDSSRWGKRARHHQQKSTTKIQAKKSSQMHECKLPLNKCISLKFSFLDAHHPGNMNWVRFSPLLVMHESSLQIQACASQI